MNKLYILICAIMLSGCGEPLTMGQRQKAIEYCKSYNAELAKSANLSNEVTEVACRADGRIYAIPKEALK